MSPAKKAAPKKAAGKAKGKDITITLVAGVGADPSDAEASLGKTHGTKPDRIRWDNQTDRGHTITFTVWPFAEPPEPIAVAAGKKSKWYTLYDSTVTGMYGYAVDPTINPPSGPPDSPAVLVGD